MHGFCYSMAMQIITPPITAIIQYFDRVSATDWTHVSITV
jgi:hypothetical protein